MTWFPVDDKFHSHPKAGAASLAAIGLWTLAGSWANDHLQDGNIPHHIVLSLSRGATELAEELVTVGLWRRTKSGYRFHQWDERNALRSEVTVAREKKSTGGALGNHRRWHAATGKIDPKCPYCGPSVTDRKPPNQPIANAARSDRYAPPNPSEGWPVDNRNDGNDQPELDRTTDRYTDAISDRTPNPPLPYLSPGFTGGALTTATNGRAHADSPPPNRCPNHIDKPSADPCGPCKDARVGFEHWQAEKRARIDVAAKCRLHIGELAHNCRPCAADRKAAPQ